MHKRSTRAWSVATAVLLAAGVLGTQGPGATAGTKTADRSDKVVAGAVTALRQHSTELRLTKGQSFRATDTVLDRSGATHVRMTRTYRGLPVLGGDLVVHQAADGSWAGVSRTLTAPLRMSTTPRLSKADGAGARHSGPPRPPAASATSRRRAPRAWSSTPSATARGWPGRSPPVAGTRTAPRAG